MDGGARPTRTDSGTVAPTARNLPATAVHIRYGRRAPSTRPGSNASRQGRHSPARQDLPRPACHPLRSGAAGERSLPASRSGRGLRAALAGDPGDQVLQESLGAFRPKARGAAEGLPTAQDTALGQSPSRDAIVLLARRPCDQSLHREPDVSSPHAATADRNSARLFTATAPRPSPFVCDGYADSLVSQWCRSPGASPGTRHLLGSRRCQFDGDVLDDDCDAARGSQSALRGFHRPMLREGLHPCHPPLVS